MLSLQKIALTHFKNYDFESFNFSKKIVGICGLNGLGKTNLLDAIYFCSFTKSYFATNDIANVQFNKDGFRLEAHFENNNVTQKVICINRVIGKKEFFLNDVPYSKLSEHIGTIPCVIIAPDDVEIIIGGSELKRRYLDSIICQLDKDYLYQLMIYNKVLQQRNSLFKTFADGLNIDFALVEILNIQLTTSANIVFEKRMYYCNLLMPLITSFYKSISNNKELITFKYISQLQENDYGSLLKNNFERDKILQRTTSGIHKDDIQFLLNDLPFKNIASQGQRKSLLFALKLAQYQLLKNYTSFSPILLLDDVFEKLDEQRMTRLLQWVCCDNDGQVFITDTHKKRLEDIFNQLNIDGQIIEL